MWHYHAQYTSQWCDDRPLSNMIYKVAKIILLRYLDKKLKSLQLVIKSNEKFQMK